MKSRKLRAGGSKHRAVSDVSPSTSLPPLVQGPLRCFLRVTVSRLLWTVHNPPSPAFVRLRWWGESSDGTRFFPRDASVPSQKSIRTTARFAVRCGPKQFTSYLADMGSLMLDVVSKPDHLPVARAQVVGICRLSLSHSVSGFYTLVSPTSEKLGEVQLSLNLEPLAEAYDSSSSAPPTDVSQEGRTLTVPSEPKTAGSGKDSAGGSGRNTPRGKDHLYFQNPQRAKETLENLLPAHTHVAQSQEGSPEKSNTDVLSVILERGNKLRDAMLASSLKCDLDSGLALRDSPFPLPKDNVQLPVKVLPSPAGMLLENILQAASAHNQSHVDGLVSDRRPDHHADFDSRAIDLLLGTSESSPPYLWDGQHSPPESLPDLSSVCEDSELNDPQYDASLLENLFYKAPIFDSKPDDSLEEETKGNPSQSVNKEKQRSQFGPSVNKRSPAQSPGIHSDLDEEQLNFLNRVKLMRVTIDSLTVRAASSAITPRTRGRPPRPSIPKKCTYFVEYTFPVTPATVHHRTGDTEVTRAVSSKVTGGVVKFDQTSVFSVNLDSATIQSWLETDLIFKIHSRRSDQKKADAVGQAVHPLRIVLQNKNFRQSIVLPVHTLQGSTENQEVGPLKVCVEFGADGSFSSVRVKEHLTVRPSSPPTLGPPKEDHSRLQPAESRIHSPVRMLNVKTPQKPREEPSCHPGPLESPRLQWPQQDEEPEVLLHALLMVPDGKNFTTGPPQAPNVYLNCKMFWCDETARSVVSWGQRNPIFNFAQVTPVALTSKLLERMRNNVMVIEVWQKTGFSGQDQLVGLVKLPLHQFYMSFRDPRVAQLLLRAQYPVLAVDCYMPVLHVFSGSCMGNLRVLLAMGQSEQIVALQRARDELSDPMSHLVKPVHLLDHQPSSSSSSSVTRGETEVMREHVFVVKVEKISGLTPLQSTVWGEADCYIQYTFPCQDQHPAELDPDLIETSLNLKTFRTTTTLCLPDPSFDHTDTHVLVAPHGLPVQKLLLDSLSSRGLSGAGGGGGVQFDVWCRYYYPNVRDQLVSRGMLPLSKLCAMVTMQSQGHDEAQKFSLPLVPRTDGPSGGHHQPSGLLDVCVRYKHRAVRCEAKPGRGAASRLVTLVVQVHRACGLKAAARLISGKDERFSYFVGVGLNPFVTVQLSFLPESQKRWTRTVARTFCPEFDHHAEVPCDVLAQRSSGETCSLAEQLEQASAIFTVWNKDHRNALAVPKCPDVMLGTVKVPLSDLLYRRTGVSGWFGLYLTLDSGSSQHQQVLVGGLELNISFAHHSDRERVVKAAQGSGWETERGERTQPLHEESWEESVRKISVTFSLPRAWIPLRRLCLVGLTELQRSTYCYFRYKFYDQEAFCSSMKHPHVEDGAPEEDGLRSVSFEGSRTVELRATQPLLWYLREEKLEVQLWVAFNKDRTKRPDDADRLVGSAFLDLSSLATTTQRNVTLSGVYPLFRRSADDLQGAALRIHVALTAHHQETSAETGHVIGSDRQEEAQCEEVEAADPALSLNGSRTQREHQDESLTAAPHVTSVGRTETSLDQSFPVTVVVDRAMHLNLRGCPLAERNEVLPCCCVSFSTADSEDPASTAVVANTDCPVWDYELDCRLSKELLVEPQQALVFKVWHKGEMERVIGFAPVDLSPLLCGFLSVCGWYNITDFSGQCHGQIKVSVTPLKDVQELREQRRAVNGESDLKESPSHSQSRSQSVPRVYQTTATYSSFPAHISRYPEQHISSPDHTRDALFSHRSGESVRHHQHMDQVRLHHQSLQDPSVSSDVDPSSSMLICTLRKKLGELDNIQKYFSRKLSTPTFSYMSEGDGRSRTEEPMTSQTDPTQLLPKSSLLVGGVNDIMSGLRGSDLERIPSDAHGSSDSSSARDDDHVQAVTGNVSGVPRASETSSPFTSPNIPEDPTDWEPPQGTHGSSCGVKVEETEGSSETDGGGEEEEDDEEYEEEVLKPRHLNEVTSLTDRTSPWTSILSEPDLVSLESLEVLTERQLSAEEEEEEEVETLPAASRQPAEKAECTCCIQESVDTSDGSESDDERTAPTSDGREPDDEPTECFCSPSVAVGAELSHDTPGCASAHVSPLHPSVPVSIPNFFLSSQQLEASIRAVRLAPSFSNTSSSVQPGGPSLVGPSLVGPSSVGPPSVGPSSVGPPSVGPMAPPRRARQRPNMSPSSMKKETERIAKIFASHFDESS